MDQSEYRKNWMVSFALIIVTIWAITGAILAYQYFSPFNHEHEPHEHPHPIPYHDHAHNHDTSLNILSGVKK